VSALASMQRDFADALEGRGAAIASHLAVGNALPAPRGLAIYANAYRMRLLDALGDGFEHTAKWLGARRFERLASDFVAENPPRDASLRRCGDGFPRWLGHRLPGSPAIAEMAALDHALRAAFDGPDAPTLTPARLAARLDSADELPLAFVPTLQRLVLRHNTLAIWHALDGGSRVPRARRLRRAVTVAVWRIEWRPHFRSLPPQEARAMRWVEAGTTLEALCVRQDERDPGRDAASDMGALLRRWMDEAMLRAD
jgi:hypothetical protein